VDYSQLQHDPALRQKLENAIKEAVVESFAEAPPRGLLRWARHMAAPRQQGNSLMLEHVKVRLSPGSVIAAAKIHPPSGVSFDSLELRLMSSQSFHSHVASKVIAAIGASEVSTGFITISDISFARSAERLHGISPELATSNSAMDAGWLLAALLCGLGVPCFLWMRACGLDSLRAAKVANDATELGVGGSVWRFGRILDAGRPYLAILDSPSDLELQGTWTRRGQPNLLVADEACSQWRRGPHAAAEQHVLCGFGDLHQQQSDPRLGSGVHAAMHDGTSSKARPVVRLPQPQAVATGGSTASTDSLTWRLGQRLMAS